LRLRPSAPAELPAGDLLEDQRLLRDDRLHAGHHEVERRQRQLQLIEEVADRAVQIEQRTAAGSPGDMWFSAAARLRPARVVAGDELAVRDARLFAARRLERRRAVDDAERSGNRFQPSGNRLVAGTNLIAPIALSSRFMSAQAIDLFISCSLRSSCVVGFHESGSSPNRCPSRIVGMDRRFRNDSGP
jgi:hypothetical protein